MFRTFHSNWLFKTTPSNLGVLLLDLWKMASQQTQTYFRLKFPCVLRLENGRLQLYVRNKSRLLRFLHCSNILISKVLFTLFNYKLFCAGFLCSSELATHWVTMLWHYGQLPFHILQLWFQILVKQKEIFLNERIPSHEVIQGK